MDVCLVAGTRTKRDGARRAEELYDSALFHKSRRYARAHFDRWYILSARYGLVDPDRIIEPYDVTLEGMAEAARMAWSLLILRAVLRRAKADDAITLLAGDDYREFLVPELEARGYTVHVPLAGMRIGEQLRWLDDRLPDGRPESSAARDRT